jgi:hypothetical protein
MRWTTAMIDITFYGPFHGVWSFGDFILVRVARWDVIWSFFCNSAELAERSKRVVILPLTTYGCCPECSRFTRVTDRNMECFK